MHLILVLVDRIMFSSTFWRRIFFLLTACLVWTGCLGQSSAFEFTNPRARQVKLPFEFQRNLIIVSAQINGKGPYNLMVDTGVGTSIITDPKVHKDLRLPEGQRFRVAGVGEESALEAFLTEGVHIEMKGIEAKSLKMLVLTEDVLDLSSYVGIPIHGILGKDLFQSFIVEVRAHESQLICYDASRYHAPRGLRWANIPLQLEGDKAYITTSVSLTNDVILPLKLVLDTGAGHALSLETGSDSRLTLPTQVLRTHLGRGLSGNINGYLGRINSIRLGRYKLKNLITSFPDDADVRLRTEIHRNGNIGLELLKRFYLVIDYPHNRMFMRPNSQFHDPFEHDMCGLDLIATGDDYRTFVIVKIEPGSPASTANLKPGDQIVTVNLAPASTYSLTQLSRLLHSANGRSVIFTVRRADGEMHAAIVKLKRQI